MSAARYDMDPATSTTPGQSHTLIGTSPPPTGPQKQRPTIPPASVNHAVPAAPPFPQVLLYLVAPSQRLPRVRGRCVLQRRRLLRSLHHSNQLVKTIHTTPAERIDPWGNPRHTGTDIWRRNRDNPTKFPQLAPAQFNIIHRQGFLSPCPQISA